eukprot:TRINITY_DN4947_c0_g1_i1.p1 TRINITY_DN4947_c0_g1~~TRINITY_DN4947_c0_g1_i1.p1  ORF type:complete len:177 (+),score=43.17 TRINITY_DN4947_c0_g1_i1:53-532(+)
MAAAQEASTFVAGSLLLRGDLRAVPVPVVLPESYKVSEQQLGGTGGSSSNAGLASFAAAAATTFAGHAWKRGSRRKALQASATSGGLPVVDRAMTKQFRRDLLKSDQYFKFGRTQMQEALVQLKAVSGSALFRKIRKKGFQLRRHRFAACRVMCFFVGA